MQEEENNLSTCKAQNNKRKRVSENASSLNNEDLVLVLVPNQSGDANTISGLPQEQW